jgi:hypothetical protein
MRETTIKILDEHHQTDLFPQPTMGKREQKVKKNPTIPTKSPEINPKLN